MALFNKYIVSLPTEKTMEKWFLYMMSGIPVLIGILAGMPSFIVTYKERGTWHIDWIKVIAIMLPALLIISLPHLYYVSPFGKYIPAFTSAILSETSRTISGFVFGYTLLFFPEKRN
jgi:hypothetical protein